MCNEYNFLKIERQVQSYWYKNKPYKISNLINKLQPKFYCLVMLPYPSGKLHMGHVRNYTIGDVIARFQRLLGKQVLHPMGWDAFGLPAEQAAISNKLAPEVWTLNNIKYMKKQLIRLGFSYDWDREILTCDSNFYHWEQWLFLKLYKQKLIYRKKSFVNWCTYHKTVLANEQVINNTCWRCNSKVIFKKINQWFIKLTSYTNELYYGLAKLSNWPKEVISMQRNWLGPIKGIKLYLNIINADYLHHKLIDIFLENIELIPSITGIIISLDHPIVEEIIKHQLNIRVFVTKCINKNYIFDHSLPNSHIKQIAINTQLLVTNPVTKQLIPIWLVNNIYFNHNTIAQAICPAHDLEHYKFAKKYKLNIISIIKFNNIVKKFLLYKKLTSFQKQNFCKLYNSNEYNNLSLYKAKKHIYKNLLNLGLVDQIIQYKVKDWCISRQRLWGVPIPIIKNSVNDKFIKFNDNDLPIIIKPHPSQQHTYIILKKNKIITSLLIKRSDIETLDTFIESAWYYVRYLSNTNQQTIFNQELANFWLPIDQYIGGIEHAILHLLYFRLFHKLMRDLNLINSNEPTYNLLCQGMVVADAFYYLDQYNNYHWVSKQDLNIIKQGRTTKITHKNNLHKIYYAGKLKMSKSKNNGIDPQLIITKYGADTLRLFIMFAAPVKMKLEWDEAGIKGMQRFLHRLWKLVINHLEIKLTLYANNTKNIKIKQTKLVKLVNITIINVFKDLKYKLSFNTAISKIFILLKHLIKFNYECVTDCKLMNRALKQLLIMIYPFTPHIVSCLWNKLDPNNDIDQIRWPLINHTLQWPISNSIEILILINNKFKNKLVINKNISLDELQTLILQNKKIKLLLHNKKINKVIYIKHKLINIII